MKAQDEVEVWADGYGFVEFQRTGIGLVPYHQESHTVQETLPIAAPMLSTEEGSAGDGTAFTLLA
ncbi:hypothetical protein [Stutzerimonas stutzeri]|uniref:hypothetical protein n=1 Tax=Stutzerimonas stutzeri TaxID=316 RepID=UPI00210D3ECC|nr:hypothetical protein [Stutzerimonas stutzeri]MCQ4318901.1 hypothetical protein [Stutzerimonas stutzeri]